MSQTIGRNINRNETATQATIELNSSTATKIADANLFRTVLEIYIDPGAGNNMIFIKTQAAGVDNLKQGPWLGKDGVIYENFWKMATDNIYTGEVSAISNSGTPTVFVTEY